MALLGMVMLSAVAQAQEFPNKPIRFVVPFEGGGGGDAVARRLGAVMGERLKQPIVVDVKPGASTTIGSEIVARAAPDGYTIMIISPTHAINPSLIKPLPFDPVADFTPIALVATSPYIITVNPKVPAGNLSEFIALARREPGKLNYASSGIGSSLHLAGELFKVAANLDITHVPYKGSGPALIDVIGGHVEMLPVSLVTAMPNIRDGRLRGLAVTSLTRNAAVPDLPTVAESGYPGFEAIFWFGILAPARTPPEIVTKLHSEIMAAAHAPAVAEALAAQGAQASNMTSAQFGQFFRAEIKKWGEVVRTAGIKAE
jgi:tripartite-type tricarboxylate transporter receptor subunit TctC